MFSHNAFKDGFGFGGTFSSSSTNPNPFSSSYGDRRRQEAQQYALRRSRMMEEDRRRKAERELRKRREYEIAKRREEEQRRRQESQQPDLHRQRMMEEERQRKQANHEVRKRREHEMVRREEEQRRREIMLQRDRSRMEQIRRSRQELGQDHPVQKKISSFPPGTVVRGPDGNLYRIAAPSRRERENDMALRYSDSSFGGNTTSLNDRNKVNEEEETFFAKVSDMAEDNILVDEPDSSQSTAGVSMPQSWNGCHETSDDDDSLVHDDQALAAKKHAPLNEIIVENVPDEEDDELREMKSVWRNRIPGPGQWIEPVESFI